MNEFSLFSETEFAVANNPPRKHPNPIVINIPVVWENGRIEFMCQYSAKKRRAPPHMISNILIILFLFVLDFIILLFP